MTTDPRKTIKEAVDAHSKVLGIKKKEGHVQDDDVSQRPSNDGRKSDGTRNT